MNRTLVDYYRCPEEFVCCALDGEPSRDSGYFRFGSEAICHSKIARGTVHRSVTEDLHDALTDSEVKPGRVSLTFDPCEAVDRLRFERYCAESRNGLLAALANQLYYLVRPLLGVSVRRHLQRARLTGWRSISFPRWPVDRTVEQLHATLLRLCLQAGEEKEIPFIWFWPSGFSSCVAVTHDVETLEGRRFCSALMDLDESFGIRSSFQLIPENRYSLSMQFLDSMRSRGFEVNVHDLNHDGRLFASQEQFLQRARRINQYVRAFGAQGFRSGALYRNLDWYDALDISYDMSVPNCAHLDPQRGGCCTVMPYFVGDILELPLTTIQDYSLFHILGDYSIDLWRRQLALIDDHHGMATFNIHPDYVIPLHARSIYVQLLQHMARLRSEGKIWLALPGEINRWWRNRGQMRIVRRSHGWTIEGPDRERAQLAYARLRNHEIEYCWAAVDSERSTPTHSFAQ
jgi:hypothetical protein